MNGIFYINKPKGITSFDLCFKLRKVFNTKSIGHTGTLDPNATGVMVVLVGKACKLNQFLVTDTKEYEAHVRFGIETDTLDIDGKIINSMEYSLPSKDDLLKAMNKFVGKLKQVPPMTSAIKVNGKKLYEYQRDNIEVDIPIRDVEVFNIELLDLYEDGFSFKTKVSSGTYIRTLAFDICKELGLIGTLVDLKRSKVDDIDLMMCDELEDVLNMNYHIHNAYEILSTKYEVYETDRVDDVKNGKVLKIDSDQDMLLIAHNKEALAIYYRESDNRYRSKRGLF